MADASMRSFSLEAKEAAEDAARWWWAFLLTGVAWIIVSWLILRWDYTTVGAIAGLFGVIAIFFGINEFLMLGGSSWGWKVVHGLLGVLFIAAGVVALMNPFDTFVALAALVGLLFILKGIFDIVVAFATKDEISLWWLQLMVGIVELLLGFWAAGPGYENWGNKVVLLVLWVGLACLFRGITELIFGFKLRGAKKDFEAFDREMEARTA